jgi:hypothetical protein
MATEIKAEDRRSSRWLDWTADLDDGREAELQALRATTNELREKVGRLEHELRRAGRTERELRDAVGVLARRGWRRRRRLVASLRTRKLI